MSSAPKKTTGWGVSLTDEEAQAVGVTGLTFEDLLTAKSEEEFLELKLDPAHTELIKSAWKKSKALYEARLQALTSKPTARTYVAMLKAGTEVCKGMDSTELKAIIRDKGYKRRSPMEGHQSAIYVVSNRANSRARPIACMFAAGDAAEQFMKSEIQCMPVVINIVLKEDTPIVADRDALTGANSCLSNDELARDCWCKFETCGLDMDLLPMSWIESFHYPTGTTEDVLLRSLGSLRYHTFKFGRTTHTPDIFSQKALQLEHDLLRTFGHEESPKMWSSGRKPLNLKSVLDLNKKIKNLFTSWHFASIAEHPLIREVVDYDDEEGIAGKIFQTLLMKHQQDTPYLPCAVEEMASMGLVGSNKDTSSSSSDGNAFPSFAINSPTMISLSSSTLSNCFPPLPVPSIAVLAPSCSVPPLNSSSSSSTLSPPPSSLPSSSLSTSLSPAPSPSPIQSAPASSSPSPPCSSSSKSPASKSTRQNLAPSNSGSALLSSRFTDAEFDNLLLLPASAPPTVTLHNSAPRALFC